MKSTRTTRDEIERVVKRALPFWRRAVIAFVVTVLVAVPYAFMRPRLYRSETVVLYQETIRSADLPGGSSDGPSDAARRLGVRLREAVTSRASLEAIVAAGHLYPSVVEQRGLIGAVDEMRAHIGFHAREGDTFAITFDSSTPDEAQDVTRRLGERLIKEATGRRAEGAQALKAFVDAECERNKIDLKMKEATFASFLALHPEFKRVPGSDGLTAPPSRAPAPPGAAVTTEASGLLALEQRAAWIDATLKSAGRPSSAPAEKPEPPPAVPDSSELVAARRDLVDTLARFTDRHPDVQAARARLRSAESAHAAALAAAQGVARAQAARELASLEVGVPAREAEQERLTQELALLRAQIATRRAAAGPAAPAKGTSVSATGALAGAGAAAVALEIEFRRLQREVNETGERQRQLDDRQFKASIAASSVMDDRNIQVSILDPAYRPTHSISPPRSRLVVLALVLALVFALATALISANLDDRIHGRADLEQLESVRVLAFIPQGGQR